MDPSLEIWLFTDMISKKKLRMEIHNIFKKYYKMPDPEYQRTKEGKPYFENFSEISFSISHSNKFAVLAVGNGFPIGIDIEFIRPRNNLKEIAEFFFSESEFAAIKSLSSSFDVSLFYRTWVKKEALVKAAGTSIFSKEFNISIEIKEAYPYYGQWEKIQLFNLCELNFFPGYAAAVCCIAEYYPRIKFM